MSASLPNYIEKNRERFLEELITLLKFPSISSLSERKEELNNCANWLKGHLSDIGLHNCAVYPTEKHPIVYGEWLDAKGKSTLLIYGHYDVQPVDPLNLWDNPPFEPVIKEDKIFARGGADDKGQFFAHVKALEALLKLEGKLPINVKIILEGEEEIGSSNLYHFIAEHKDLLASDIVAVSDSPMYGKDIPTICYGLRGLAYMEIKIQGPNKDLHSGSFGGVVANPIEILTKIVAQLKDHKGCVTIPGFYDQVIPLTKEERENFRSLPLDENEYLKMVGAPMLTGEEGYSTLERVWTRPTLDPNGIVGGFTGEGAKTVIPATASCKISMRLVPDQKPAEISQLFRNHIEKICPPTVKCEIIDHHGGLPYLMPLNHPAIRIAARSLERGFGKKPVFVREGGSIPIVVAFKETLNCDTVLLPLGLPDENSHSPNENFYLPNFFSGISSSANFMIEMATGY